MYASELFENGKPRIVVTYPGRFQPFHKGHTAVFKKLQKEFGNENVFVITSNDTSSAKNPFSFGDKYQLITTAGIPAHSIVETNKMYSLPDDFDSSNTIFVTAVGSPDADRLRPDSFLKKDRKDKEGNIIKRAGDPGYYKLWSSPEDKVTADQHGYVVIVPEVKSDITIDGETYDASHGTECRMLWNKVRKNPTQRNEFLKALYGKATPELVHIFEKIALEEDVLPNSSDSTSPIHGAPVKTLEQDLNEHDDIAKGIFVFEDAAGVGVVATNKKMAKDPRYSMSITQDVKPTTPKKQLRAFRLTAENMDHSKDDRAVPELKAALLAHKNKIAGASEDKVYDIIDKLMTRIAKSHGISGQKLHDMWVDEYKQIPDTWIMKVTEDVQMSKPATEPNLPEMLAQLLPIAMRVLKINVLPKIILQKHLEAHDGQPSFGRFVNHECTIYLGVADRHPNDIFRTLAHELTHFKQYLNHELNHKSGETGSPEENEAHATAGVVMREYNKAHPDNLLSNPLNVD
jgi:cytidyltransferase-like protein